MQHFDWEQLQSFLRTVETGSLSAAARKLGSSQPTVGRHIEALEKSLQVRLFNRTPQGLRLTESGDKLAAHAARMGRAADDLARAAAGQAETVSGSVRITASEIVANHILPSLLAGFARRHPEITIDVVASDASPSLLSREVDIALRMYRPEQLDLVIRKIADIPIGAYAHKSYLEQHGTPRTLQDCRNHRLIGDDRETLIVQAAREMGVPLSRDDFCLRSDSFLVQWNAVRAGLGIGFCQVPLAANEPDLVRLLPDLAIPSLPVWLAAHRDLRASRRIRLVYDDLAQRFPKKISGTSL